MSKITKPTILICHEKHDNRYFIINNDKELYDTALKIVIGRFKTGYFYYDPSENKPGSLDFDELSISTLPESMQFAAKLELKKHKKAMSQWKYEMENWELLKRAIKEKNGELAWQILRDNSDGEYERVSLEPGSTEY